VSCLLEYVGNGKKPYADHLCRRAPLTQTLAGKEIREKLWDDIWVECLKVDEKLEPLKPSTL
jgi:hypothetical protein